MSWIYVTCPFCGAVGREEKGDPAPGVCPPCLDAKMKQATARFGPLVDALGLEDALREQVRYLVDVVGLTREATRHFLQICVDVAFSPAGRVQ